MICKLCNIKGYNIFYEDNIGSHDTATGYWQSEKTSTAIIVKEFKEDDKEVFNKIFFANDFNFKSFKDLIERKDQCQSDDHKLGWEITFSF